MMCAYQANIPQPTDQISQSQADILGNFQALDPFINGIFDLPPQGAFPAPTGNNIIFAKLYAPTGKEEVFIQNAAGTTNIPITATFPAGNAGWTYLPSGVLMCWNQGVILAGSQTSLPVLFSTVPNFPGFTTSSLAIQLTRINNATSTNFIQLQSYTQLQFIARRSTSTTTSPDTFIWLAIGL